jgi:hypothetical protein
MQDGSVQGWRQILDRHHTALIDDLGAQFDREMELKIADATAAERERAANELTNERERFTSAASEQRERFNEERERLSAEHERFNSEQRERFDEERERFNSEQRERFNAELERSNAEHERFNSEQRERFNEERARAAEESRLRLSESLNQTLRRIRHTAAEHEALQLLLEDSPADRAVVLLIENNQARLAAWRNVQLREEEDEDRAIDLADAAALASCVETRDPVVALASPAEISSVLSLALSSTIATEPSGPPAKAYLFPITVRQTTVAVMLASGDVTPAPIELLCEAVGMKLESLDVAVAISSPAQEKAPAPLVNIAPSPAHTEKPKPAENATTWSKLTPEQQALHLRAQRFARVRTAQIRISESEDLRKGTLQGDIYSALRPSIDAARREYQRSFMAQSPTMVDYLHLELVRSLARENSRLMGQDYPGPIELI